MSAWHVMLGFSGRIGRVTFAIGLIAAILLFALGIQLSLMALPTMAEWLAPQGINAGLVLNFIWCVLGLLLMWSLIALGAKRLRDRGRPVWWIVVVVVPLAALAVINDAIFLVSRTFTLPRYVQLGALLASGLIGVWVLAECLIGDSMRDQRKLPTREAPSS